MVYSPGTQFKFLRVRIASAGTNGALTFGQAMLPYGDSEPVPCQWNGGGQGAGRSGCVQNGDDPTAAATGGHYGVEIDGIIAPFWCDLNPGDTVSANEGVFYQIIKADDIRLAAFNKVIVEYQVPVFQASDAHDFDDTLCHFQVLLFGDGTVIFQYKDMPAVSGSWSHESIGFEDKTGTQGVQISYAVVPAPGTAYKIPPACHVEAGGIPAFSCCSSIPCECEAVECEVETDYPFVWNDITSTGVRVEDNGWEQNADDGWLHVDLPFEFHWFGKSETVITIGTNGTFHYLLFL
jgi:hypothetical protein